MADKVVKGQPSRISSRRKKRIRRVCHVGAEWKRRGKRWGREKIEGMWGKKTVRDAGELSKVWGHGKKLRWKSWRGRAHIIVKEACERWHRSCKAQRGAGIQVRAMDE